MEMIDKKKEYLKLVQKRKTFQFKELLNPSAIDGGQYDCDHVELWAHWQGNLDAKILLVGKDFGGLRFFREFKGRCDPNSITNKNLMILFKQLNINIGKPFSPNKNAPVFFTNSIFGIIDTKDKGGNRISSAMRQESTTEFLLPLIEIIQPKVIITLGLDAYKSFSDEFIIPKALTLKKLVNLSPLVLPSSKLLFPVFHCGGLGLANRSLKQQTDDWIRIATKISKIENPSTF